MPNDICFSYRYSINDTVTKTSLTVPDPLNEARIPYGDRKDFKDFTVKELVPHINRGWNTTQDQQHTLIGGMSYGGLSAGFISFYTDSVFGDWSNSRKTFPAGL